MRVLVLSQHFWPESFRINDVVESLIKVKCDVTVLTGQPNYPEGSIFEGFSASGAGLHTHAHGYSIFRVPLIPRGRGGGMRLALNYLSFLLSATLMGPWLLRRHKFDVVFVYGTSPILQVIPAIWIAFLKRAKLVTWVQDLWPQSLEVTGFVRNKQLLSAVGHVVRWIYRRNDLLLVQSRAFVDQVASMAGSIPVRYHPNPGDNPQADSPLPRSGALILKAGFNVVFAGNLGKVQALDTVLDAAEMLLHETALRFV
ncbi:MAG: glycosyltransferase WbuB, partial [Alcaligenaceae bacterium]